VRTFLLAFFCARATIVDESMPPERKAPTGTSASSCIFTAAERSRSSSSMHSAGLARKRSLAPRAADSAADQYVPREDGVAESVKRSQVPGISFSMPS
jgi:hypothetical protein